MITARSEPSFDTRIEQAAADIATQSVADAQNAELARGGDPVRWRVAELVWPLFAASVIGNSRKSEFR